MTTTAMQRIAQKPWLQGERAIVAQAWHLISPLMRKIMAGLALLSSVGTFLGAFVGSDQPLYKSVLWSLLLPGLMLCIMVFFSLPLAVQRLQSVAAADTAPGHRKALKAVGFATWGALALLICILVVVFNHLDGKTPSASTLFAQLTIGVCIGTWFLTCFGRPSLWFVWVIGWVMPSAMKSAVYAGAYSVYAVAGAAAPLLLAGAVAVSAWFFHWAYFAGTPGDRAARASRIGRYNNSTHNGASVKPSGNRVLDYIRFELLGAWSLRFVHRWPIRIRITLGLGPQWNPLYSLGFVPPLAALVAALLLWFGGPPMAMITAKQMTPTMTGMLMGILAVSFGNLFMLSLAHTRTEQAVLMLLPGAPAAAERSRWLAQRIALTVLANMAWLIALVLLTFWVLGGPATALALLLKALLCSGAMDLALTQTTPRRFAETTRFYLGLFLFKFAGMIIVIIALQIWNDSPPISTLFTTLWCAVMLTCAVILYRRRCRSAPALPLLQ
ncbi:MAG: hypothetical protein RL341_357, partial [Pseudomonadota bacterium]